MQSHVGHYAGLEDELRENEKLEDYASYFKLPLLSSIVTCKESHNVQQQLLKDLENHNLKANKLVKIAKSYKILSEKYHKSLQVLEEDKISANKIVDELEKLIESMKENLNLRSTKIKEQAEEIEILKAEMQGMTNEKTQLESNLQKCKTEFQNKVMENELALNNEKKKYIKADEHNAKKIELLKNEIAVNEKMIEDEKNIRNKYEINFKQEKAACERLRTEAQLCKSENFELKRKLEEQKLKKYKYKQLNSLTCTSGSRFKNCCTQTNTSDNNFSDSQEISSGGEECNELYYLEEEQSLAYNSNFNSVEVCNELSIDKSATSDYINKNSICILPQKYQASRQDFKLEIAFCEGISIEKVKKNQRLLVSSSDSIRICPNKLTNPRFWHLLLQSSRILCNKCSSRVNKALHKLVHDKESESNFSESLNNKATNSSRSLPSTPKNQNLTLETWGDSITSPSTEDTISLTLDIFDESKTFDRELQIKPPVDPLKDYFIKVCQSAKISCAFNNKAMKIPTNKLYCDLLKQKIPLCDWPRIIQIYLGKRLNSLDLI